MDRFLFLLSEAATAAAFESANDYYREVEDVDFVEVESSPLNPDNPESENNNQQD